VFRTYLDFPFGGVRTRREIPTSFKLKIEKKGQSRLHFFKLFLLFLEKKKKWFL